MAAKKGGLGRGLDAGYSHLVWVTTYLVSS